MLSCIFNPVDCAINAIPVEWYWGAGGLFIGYLWGKFGVLGLVPALSAVFYWLGRRSREPDWEDGGDKPVRKRKPLFPRLRKLFRRK